MFSNALIYPLWLDPQDCAAHRLCLWTHRCGSVLSEEQSEAELMRQSEPLRLNEGTFSLFLWNHMHVKTCWLVCLCCYARLVGGSVWTRPLHLFASGIWGWPQPGGHQWKHGTAPGCPYPLATGGAAAPGALSQHQRTEQGETLLSDFRLSQY